MLYRHAEPLATVVRLRQRLKSLRAYLFSCRAAVAEDLRRRWVTGSASSAWFSSLVQRGDLLTSLAFPVCTLSSSVALPLDSSLTFFPPKSSSVEPRKMKVVSQHNGGLFTQGTSFPPQ